MADSPKVTDIALKQYDILTRGFLAQAQLIWNRSQFFLVANTALLGFLAFAIRATSEVGRAYLILLVALAFVGLTMSVLWIIALHSGYMALDRIERLCVQKEEAAFGDLQIMRGARSNTTARSRVANKLVAFVFGFIWIIVLFATQLFGLLQR
jgi:hypothetical protein